MPPVDLDLVTKTLADGRSSLSTRSEGDDIGLTLAWHADVDRVGARLRLRPGRTALSRTAPDFDGDGPLADPYLSRKPITFTRASDTVTLDPGGHDNVEVDGAPLTAPRTFAAADIERGVVIVLADRVALLLGHIPLGAPEPPRFGIIGDSLAIRRLRAEIMLAAPVRAPVLVRGESGTGKELVAGALHAAGPRSDGPIRVLNMAAIPAATAASALFGHSRGAFTGADRDSPGYFGDADGGTLFLDEIGELPDELQPMLLRAVETGEIQPVGARRARKVDVRLITATDAALEAAVDEGRFRLPLLHRLAGIEVWLPPLRQRRDDIPRLLVHFLRAEFTTLGVTDRLAPTSLSARPWLGPAIVALLMRHAWPGNVRELANVARQIALVGNTRSRVRASQVAVLARIAAGLGVASDTGERITADIDPSADEAPLTDTRMLEALRAHNWSVNAAARALGTAKINIYRFIDRSPALRKASEIPDDELRAVHAACGGDLDAMSQRLQVSARALTFRLKELDPPL
ncbi:MAG: sigma 54-interacting transcriptional regulator [bacterium]|nr:sigma-54-dependent Fis family transcriptional regulator [Myxococcales bacterium]